MVTCRAASGAGLRLGRLITKAALPDKHTHSHCGEPFVFGQHNTANVVSLRKTRHMPSPWLLMQNNQFKVGQGNRHLMEASAFLLLLLLFG